ncbi:MAG: hypothetical protein NVS9B13_02460 [Candidatus Acidiferrum sp.]
MNHSEAVQLSAAEKYLLGELTADAREAFEDHYFDCLDCARDVRLGVLFMDSGRELAHKPSLFGPAQEWKEPQGRWFAWLRPAFAAPLLAGLLFIILYQNTVTFPNARQSGLQDAIPQVVQSVSLLAANSRGGTGAVVHVTQGKPFHVFFDVPPGDFSEYRCELQSVTGNSLFSMQISAGEAKNTVELAIPPKFLSAGSYSIVVFAKPPDSKVKDVDTAIARYYFTLEISR